MKHAFSNIIILSSFLLSVFVPGDIKKNEFSEYRVILDPGHGGISLRPRKRHGDKYDMLSRKYLEPFKEGAAYRGQWEHIIAYRIANRAKQLLDLCKKDGDFQSFIKILRKYSIETPKRIIIQTHLSRGDSRNRTAIKKRRDPNSEFRLFDYPNGKNISPGRISRINSLKPHLVVSLHMAASSPKKYRGMNSVIVAPYSMLNKGLRYLKGKLRDKRFFSKSAYSDWFKESNKRTDFGWFIKDTSVYFTGYSNKRKKRRRVLNQSHFKGYRYNMVTWNYKSNNNWQEKARKHPHYTSFAKSYKTFRANGPFWEREKSVYEKYRRDSGPEGYGGDNLYASNEIIRYILLSLKTSMNRSYRELRLAKPYISIWSLPLHVNAICAFIELGYLNRQTLRYVLTKKQEKIAEGVAVGIYSLLAGMKLKPKRIKNFPKGKRIDLEKYFITNDISYFDKVVAK